MKKLTFLIFAFLVAIATSSFAQSYILNNENSTVSVIGTSTLHDWKINADSINGKAEIVIEGKKVKDIASLTIDIPITGMHSGLGPMDTHMRMALSANDASSITYKLVKVENLVANSIGYTINAAGEITIVNNTKKTRLQATMEMKKDGSIRYFGEAMIDMTDYSVELPQAEMGSIKAEKDVKIVFDVAFEKE